MTLDEKSGKYKIQNKVTGFITAGRDLWVMVVSSSPFQHMKGKPDVKYVANIHGNEAVSREMALHLIEVCDCFIIFSD